MKKYASHKYDIVQYDYYANLRITSFYNKVVVGTASNKKSAELILRDILRQYRGEVAISQKKIIIITKRTGTEVHGFALEIERRY